MPYRDNQQALRALYAVATTQGGYFTAKQAGGAGYGIRHLDYHAKTGNFERISHGLYRLPTIPLSEHDDLIRLSLWSRDRSDRPQAVASHITALELHHLSDVLPTKIHLTVPRPSEKPFRQGQCCTRHHWNLKTFRNGQDFMSRVRNARFWMLRPTTPLVRNN